MGALQSYGISMDDSNIVRSIIYIEFAPKYGVIYMIGNPISNRKTLTRTSICFIKDPITCTCTERKRRKRTSYAISHIHMWFYTHDGSLVDTRKVHALILQHERQIGVADFMLSIQLSQKCQINQFVTQIDQPLKSLGMGILLIVIFLFMNFL